jgi:AbrB family looped-hinge helix DNA binding protein
MAEARLSAKNQIVIPKEAREALGLKTGDTLLVVPRGDTVILMKKPKNFAKALLGLARTRYPKDYLRKERASWD